MSYQGYHPHPHSAPPPPPGQYHWSYYRRCRGGRGISRIFWFGAGGLTAYWMMKSKDRSACASNPNSNASGWGSGWHSRSIEAPPANDENKYWSHPQHHQHHQHQQPMEKDSGFASRWGWRSSSNTNTNANNGPTFEEAAQQKQREIEKWKEEKMAQATAQAAQASASISDMTEASLDSVIAAVEGLKTKLAENRSRRPPPPPQAPEPYPS